MGLYVKHTISGTMKVLKDAGRVDDAVAVAKLFYRTEQEKQERKETVGMTDLLMAIKTRLAGGDRSSHVEDAMLDVLAKHSIDFGFSREKLIEVVESWDPNFRFADKAPADKKKVSYEQNDAQLRLVQ